MNTLVSLKLSDLPPLPPASPDSSLLAGFPATLARFPATLAGFPATLTGFPATNLAGFPATHLPLSSDLRVATKQSAQFGAGGDFFEVFQHADGRVSAVVADVCGNGADAARVAARVRPFLHSSLARGESPGDVLAALNDGLVHHGVFDRFVTAVAVRVDVDSGVAEIACAGHLGPFIRRASGRVHAIDSAMGVPLGLLAGERYDEISLRLDPDDALVLVTDGITDPLATDGDPLGELGLARRLAAAPHATMDICETLLVTGSATRDDATVLVLHLPSRRDAERGLTIAA
jgi:serine phosphatase RsbU (regulator of sigma subunit)